MRIADGKFKHDVNFDAGPSQVAIEITKPPVPVAFLHLGDFAVCSEEVPALGQKTNVLHLFDAMGDKTKIPKNCARVRLIPQCAALNDLPQGLVATHEYVQQVGCYDDVAAIDWSKYSDFNFHNL